VEFKVKKTSFILAFILALGGIMAQMQDKIKPVGAWASFLGCTQACSNYLGEGHSAHWLWGVSGYAFLINIHPELCPSGPTAFDNSFLKSNAAALGLQFESIVFNKYEDEFAPKQQEAHARVKQALENDVPVFGWELGIPEYYLLAGTDDKGYLYFDFDSSVKHCPLDSIATSGIGMAEFNLLSPTGASVEPLDQIKSALKFLQDYHSHPEQFALPGYTMGNAAYGVWITALEEGKADPFGLAYNSNVWAEARSHALGFIREMKGKLSVSHDTSLLDNAISDFGIVSSDLNQLCQIYHFPPREGDQTPENAAVAIQLLMQARAAEESGIQALLRFASQL